jgi:hypothetical protein
MPTNQTDPTRVERLTRCRICGEVAGSVSGFAPWCEGGRRGHEAEDIHVIPAQSVERLEAENAELRQRLAELER